MEMFSILDYTAQYKEEIMKLEFADGRTVNISSKEQLVKELDSLNHNNDFAILGDTDYIQTSYSESGFLFQYRDSTGMYESIEYNHDLDTVKDIFADFLEGDSSWKDSIKWERTGSGPDKTASETSTASDLTGSGSLKDELLKAAKKSALNWIKKKIR